MGEVGGLAVVGGAVGAPGTLPELPRVEGRVKKEEDEEVEVGMKAMTLVLAAEVLACDDG